jgi:hypothetical protein
MALKKSFVTPYGVSVDYWKIASVREDYIAGRMEVILGGYINHEARLSGASPFDRRDIVIQGEDYTEDMDREALYDEIKVSEEWVGAEDC